MIRAYREIYLSKAQSLLGDAFDYAVNSCGIPGNDFVKLFMVSSVSKRMENGEPAILAGKSGIEVVREIVAETKGEELQIEPQEHFGRSRNIGLGGLLPIINGIQAENTVTFLRLSPLQICRKCITRSTKQTYQSLLTSWMRE